MASNKLINVHLFGKEIGRIGLNEETLSSSFQYKPEYLQESNYLNIFPETGILSRIPEVQLFNRFNNKTFRGIPPQFADSLPDLFGSIIFKTWLASKDKHEITVLEQLAYVGNRGMGALEYSPIKKIPKTASINLTEIIEVLKSVLDVKQVVSQKKLTSKALINVFKIGSSAGGARPKILISEHKETGEIIPGDIEYSNDYDHYLIKLAIDEVYPREHIEYCYYQVATAVGINMMPSKLIENKHFATLRFDRQNGEKQHSLTATGLTGWDFMSIENSSYENLFKLSNYLKISHAQIEQLFRRMIFNVVFRNIDDHLKNHSFMYNSAEDRWNLSPAYDITYRLNPLIDFKKEQRALSINGKRSDIKLKDVLIVAEKFTIKNPRGIVKEVLAGIELLGNEMNALGIPKHVSNQIMVIVNNVRKAFGAKSQL